MLSRTTPTSPPSAAQPWQLEMFKRSLKKPLKLQALLKMAGNLHKSECLLITCGDNNGALNWHFRQAGGKWTWADVEGKNLEEISQLLGEKVHHLNPEHFPFSDNQFATIVCIDVLEHLPEDQPFMQELLRTLGQHGRAIVTVPNGDSRLLANQIKGWVGMKPDVYGHKRAGYTIHELEQSLTQAGFTVQGYSGYSRFFTEMVELLINFVYVKILGKKKNEKVSREIAPTTAEDLQVHGLAFRVYSMVFPIMKIISKLDNFLPASTNNAVIVLGSKSRRNGRVNE